MEIGWWILEAVGSFEEMAAIDPSTP